MASCINRSAPGYDALNKEFKSVTVTDNVIIGWQNANNSDQFPTVQQAKEFMKDQKTLLSLKKNNFSKALLQNLRRKKLIHRNIETDTYYVNVTREGERVGSIESLEFNIIKARNYLRINNIPLNAVSFQKAGFTESGIQSVMVKVDQSLFTAKDVLPESRGFDTAHTPMLLEHLQRIFPQLNLNVVGEKEARSYYESLPEERKKAVKFDQVNSFYYNGEVYLIRGRVTNEIAVEEVLHPFVEAIRIDNLDLFNSLLDESKKNFPVLTQQITDAYTKQRRFGQGEIDAEILTQSLARTFNNEFEQEPTQSFRTKINELLEWLKSIVQDFHKFLTDKNLLIRPRDISASATLTDIAKLLNTSEIRFAVEVTPRKAVKYSLTPTKQAVVDTALRSAVGTQKIVVNKLFSKSIESENSIDGLTVTNDITKGDDIVVLNKKDNKFYSLGTKKVFASSQQAILGTEKAAKQQELDQQIQADKTTILNALTEGKQFGEIQDQIKVFNDEISQAYRDAQVALQSFLEEDAIAIPEVILYDEATQVATKIDMLIVHTDGSIGLVNFDISNERRLAKDTFVESRDALGNDSLLKEKGIDNISNRQQKNIELQMAKRMLTNMGYSITPNQFNTVTIHLFAEAVDGKYTGAIEYDGNTKHRESENEVYIDLIMPVNVDFASEQRLNDALKDQPYSYYDFDNYPDLDDVEFNEDTTLENSLLFAEYDTLFTALKDYRKGLMNQKEAIEKIRENILVDKEKGEITENMEYAISMLSLVIDTQDAAEANRVFTQLVRDAIRETNKFIDYIQDPANLQNDEFISYVMNFKLFGRSFEALGSIADNINLNKAQKNLVNTLGKRLTLALGNRTGKGLIDDAVDDFVKALVKRESARNFTQKDLDELIKTSKDIGLVQSRTRSLLASEDQLLALMQKIFEREQSRAIDRLNQDAFIIGAAAQKLQKLDPGTDPQQLYNFMREFDDEGRFTGMYVKQIGRQYSVEKERLRDELFEDGLPLVYRDVDQNSSTYKEDIAFNIDLYNKKQAFASFMRAETIGSNGKEVSGEYHEYTEDFIKERAKYERFVPVGENGIWKKKAGVSDDEYLTFKIKYYDTKEYDKMVKIKGVPSGFVEKGHTAYFVKQQYIKIKPTTTSGKNMQSQKYIDMIADKSALGAARKEFYDVFIEYFENKYLKLIPPSTGSKMIGSVPLVKSNFYKELSDKPNIVARMWSKTANGFGDFFTEDVYQKKVAIDEDGNLIDSLPVFYVGKPRTEESLKRIEAELALLEDQYNNDEIKGDVYNNKKNELNAEAESLKSTPTVDQVSGDLGSSLLLFAGMAHNFSTLSQVEDTMKAMLNVIAEREYTPADKFVNLKVFSKGKSQSRGVKGGSRVEERARRFMQMVFYDTDRQRKGVAEKMVNGLMRLTSWSFVAFNVTGNINNFVMGKVNNNIEYLGGRFIPRKVLMRATKEFNQQVLPSIAKTTAYYVEDAIKGKYGGNVYNPNKPATKVDAIISYFRIMDSMKELQEAGSGAAGNGDGSKSFIAKALDWGYLLNESFEYALQGKIGLGVVMDVNIKNSSTGEIVNLYDAYDFDNQELKLREGFDTIVDKNGNEKPYSDNFRFDLRTKAKSINQQIHGNYAYSTRTLMEAQWYGRLAMQFHKWVGPAIRARMQREYFDENLGWMEGRYRSLFSFINHLQKEVRKGNLQWGKIKGSFLEEQKKQVSFNAEQYAQNKLLGTYRTLGELAIFAFTIGMKHLLLGLLSDEDDDSVIRRRLENMMIYQVDRTRKELSQFLPIPGLGGLTQMKQMWESPIAATGTLGKLGEALDVTGKTGYYWLTRDSDGEFYENSKVVYQNKPRKGELKLNKKWKDVIPLIYSIQKLRSFDERKEYYVGTGGN